MKFDTLQSAIQFYVQYATRGGFDVRRGGEKKIKGHLRFKYLICSRAGVAANSNVDTLNRQQLKP